MEPVTAYRPGKMAEVRKGRANQRRWDAYSQPRPASAPVVRWEGSTASTDIDLKTFGAIPDAPPEPRLPPAYAWMADEPKWEWWPWIVVAMTVIGAILGVIFFRWSNT